MPEIDKKEQVLDEFEKTKAEYEKRVKEPMIGQIILHTQSCTIGTKQKPYKTVTVDTSRANPDDLVPSPDAPMPSRYDLQRCKEKDYRDAKYLLYNKSVGEVLFAGRGKHQAFAAGKQLMAILPGLECDTIKGSSDDFRALTATSIKGPNKVKAKAEKLRDFLVPDQYIEKLSRPPKEGDCRRLRVFASIVTKEHAWMIIDFSRLVKLHVITLDRDWTKDDMTPGSDLWDVIWSQFPGGPDWIDETDKAVEKVWEWVSWVRADLKGRGGKYILKALMDNDGYCFAGIGRHLSMDFCYIAILYPGTPIREIIANDALVTDFINTLKEYMAQWRSKEFKKIAGGRTNAENPLAYRDGRTYESQYVKAIRKKYVRQTRDEYNSYAHRGLYNPRHVIGEPYVADEWELMGESEHFRFVSVWHRLKPLNAYTVIRAQAPEGWMDGKEVIPVDIREEGYKATLGPHDFHQNKANMIDWQAIANQKQPPGRKPKKKRSANVDGRTKKTLTIEQIREKAQEAQKVRDFAANIRAREEKRYGYTNTEDKAAEGDDEESGDEGENSDDEKAPIELDEPVDEVESVQRPVLQPLSPGPRTRRAAAAAEIRITHGKENTVTKKSVAGTKRKSSEAPAKGASSPKKKRKTR